MSYDLDMRDDPDMSWDRDLRDDRDMAYAATSMLATVHPTEKIGIGR